MYTDRQKIPARDFLMLSCTPFIHDRMYRNFCACKLHVTRNAKECKLPLVYMQTVYRVTVSQTSKCHQLFLRYSWKCFAFFVALISLSYEHQVMKELYERVVTKKMLFFFLRFSHQFYVISCLALRMHFENFDWHGMRSNFRIFTNLFWNRDVWKTGGFLLLVSYMDSLTCIVLCSLERKINITGSFGHPSNKIKYVPSMNSPETGPCT